MGEERSYRDERIQEGIEDSFANYKKQAIKAAKDLHYPPEVVKKLKDCTSLGQISIVMTTARQTYL